MEESTQLFCEVADNGVGRLAIQKFSYSGVQKSAGLRKELAMLAGSAAGPYDVCKKYSGKDLRYCEEQVRICVEHAPKYTFTNQFVLRSCTGIELTFTSLEYCTGYVPTMIYMNGSCPTADLSDPNLVCERYKSQGKKEYCIEQAQRCADYKDRFSKETPITLESCRKRTFSFPSLATCVEGVHSMIARQGWCKVPAKKVVTPPAPAAGGAAQTGTDGAAPKPELPPASAPAPVPAKPLVKLKDSVMVLSPSNFAGEISSPIFAVVVHSLGDNSAREELNKMKPPENPERESRIGVIDWSTEEGRSVANMIGLKAPPPGRRFVKWYVRGRYDALTGFQGERHVDKKEGLGPEVPLSELSLQHVSRPDGFGFIYATKENHDAVFAPGSGDALVVVGEPYDDAAAETAMRIFSRRGDIASFGFAKRAIWIPTRGEEGKDIALARGMRYVRGGITTYYAREIDGTWQIRPYSVPVNLFSRADAERYVEGTMENVLVIVGAKGGAGDAESDALREALITAQLEGNLKVDGKDVDRIAFVLNENVAAVFGENPGNPNELSDTVRKLSRVPLAFFYTSQNARQPAPVSLSVLPANVVPKAVPRPRPVPTVALRRNIKELTRENFMSVFLRRKRVDVVVVHSLDDDRAREFVNGLDADLPRPDEGPPPSHVVAVIDWSKPDAVKLSEYLGIKYPLPGFRYSHWKLSGAVKNSGYFAGEIANIANEPVSVQELVELYWDRPDGWGFIHIDKDNFAEHFNAGLKKAVVATGNPSDFLGSGALNQLAAERELLPTNVPHFWIHSEAAGSDALLKKLGIEYDVVSNSVSLNVVTAGESSWQSVQYTPILDLTDAADANRYIHDSDKCTLVIVGKKNGYGSIETLRLKAALLARNAQGLPVTTGREQVGRVVFITDMSKLYANATGRHAEFAEHVRGDKSEVLAYVFEGAGDERKFRPVPVALLTAPPTRKRPK